jgi:nucleotide sugar dehydrogenase
MKVAIIGMGVVGQAQEQLFRTGKVITYDIRDSEPYPRKLIGSCDFAVICVGTPARDDGSADLSAILAALDDLPMMPVLLRSTVPPGTTAKLALDYPGHLFAFAPEFIHERNGGPWHKSIYVPWMILGGEPEARLYFRPFLEKAFPSPIHECSSTEAELAKYVANLYWATRVTFVNEMAGVCAAFGADWASVREAWLMDFRINPAYTAMEGFLPGFGGKCWPKDLTALMMAADGMGYQAWFLEDIRLQNERYTK